MKKLNKKGFTLIELLAVIIILAILIAVAVPAVNRYLDNARKDTYVENIKIALKAVKLDLETGANNATEVKTGIAPGVSLTYKDYVYNINEVNKLLDRKLIESPFGKKYLEESKFVARQYEYSSGFSYSVCILDEGGNGISALSYINSDISDPSKFTDEALEQGNGNFTLNNSSASNLKRDRILKGYTTLRCK